MAKLFLTTPLFSTGPNRASLKFAFSCVYFFLTSAPASCRAAFLRRFLELGQDFLLEEVGGGLRAQGVERVADGDADALLAVAGAERAGEGDLVLHVVLLDQGLEALQDEMGTLDMAGAAQAYGDGHLETLLNLLLRRQFAFRQRIQLLVAEVERDVDGNLNEVQDVEEPAQEEDESLAAAIGKEDDLADDGASNEGVKAVREYAAQENCEVFVVCAEIEEEIAQLNDEEKKMFLDDLGLEESGVEKLIKASYQLLGLISYLTAGEPEVRAWTITRGTKAPQAAGKIHTDFERGFIRAEVVGYDDLMACGSHAAAKEKGLVRLEGKDYVVQDGDIMLFRFNV